MKKRTAILMFLCIALCGVLAACSCKHDWEELIIDDVVTATTTSKMVCATCNEESTPKIENLDCLYKSNVFIFSPNEFVERLNIMSDEVSNYIDVSLSASTSGEAYILCEIKPDNKSTPIGLVAFFDTEGSIIPIEQQDAANINQMVVTITGRSKQSIESYCNLLVAVIMTCDPSLTISDALDTADKIIDAALDGNYLTDENGISYTCYPPGDSGSTFLVSLNN